MTLKESGYNLLQPWERNFLGRYFRVENNMPLSVTPEQKQRHRRFQHKAFAIMLKAKDLLRQTE